MRDVSRLMLVGMVLAIGACASQQPIVQQPARGYGYQQRDPLRQTASDANSVESIVSSVARVGRMLGGGY
jgi:hypothetical protein